MQVKLLLFLLCGFISGCPSRDNPLDPGRCNPRCVGGKICLNGECVAPDGGPVDGGETADADPNLEPAITFSWRKPTGANISGSAFTDIPDLSSQEVLANGKDRYLVMLSVPAAETHSTSNQGGAFRIVDGDTTLASGYFAASYGTTVPVTLFAVKQLSAGIHTIKAQWSSGGTHQLHIGQRPSWLVVVRADEDDIQSRSEVFATNVTLSDSDVWHDIGKVTVKTAGDYLLVLNAPVVSESSTNECAHFRVVRTSSPTDDFLVGGKACHSPFAFQRVSFTAVGVSKLSAGDALRSQWKHTGSGSVYMEKSDGAENAMWLIALRVPKGITYKSSSQEITTTSTSYAPLNSGVQPIGTTPAAAGNHLFIFNSPQTSANGSGPQFFRILVEGNMLAEGVPSFTTYQHIPITLIGVKHLPAGKPYSVNVEWHSYFNVPVFMGKDYPHWLLAFTR